VKLSRLVSELSANRLAEEERKTLMSMLGKLHIPQSSSPAAIEAMRSLLELVNEAVEAKVSTEASTRNVLNKLSTSLSKHISTSPISAETSGDVATGTPTPADGNIEVRDESVLTTAETPGPSAKRMSIQKEEEIEDEEEEEEDGDMTNMTNMTLTTGFAPDAEGTRFINMDEDGDTIMDDAGDATVVGAGERSQIEDETLVESLLDSEA
jgi:condensin complex subunit 3